MKEDLKNVLDYVDSMMIVDKNLNVLYANRFNPRFNMDAMINEYQIYYDKRYFEVYPDLDPVESTMVECLKTGKVIIKENQNFTDTFGRIFHTRNITFPLIRYGEVVAAIELSQDITSVGDLKNASKKVTERHRDTSENTFNSNTISFNSIITNNKDMIENIRKAKLFAMDDNPVLIYGETGTGKELFVQAMVRHNAKRNKKFVIQNCAAIPDNLFESILFGSTKGAFTGAENKTGLFEMADGGILFLDELNSIPMHLQAKLLRVIQDGKVRPVGSAVEKNVNVKVITAMNKNPLQLIKDNMLREDLFYRISSDAIYLNPLRERKEDIPLYLDYYIEHFNDKYGKKVQKLTPNLRSILLKYNWPGNVRELRHVIESMVNITDEDLLSTKNLPIYLKEVIDMKEEDLRNVDKFENRISFKISLKEAIERTEKEYIIKALAFCSGNVSRAAELLGIPRQTLKFRMDKLNIKNVK
jgi:arginine utilization regulatory protein